MVGRQKYIIIIIIIYRKNLQDLIHAHILSHMDKRAEYDGSDLLLRF